ncbi:hypothetical protein D9M72_475640 [compost metagenome]
MSKSDGTVPDVQVAHAEQQRSAAIARPQRPDLVARRAARHAAQAVDPAKTQAAVVLAAELDGVVDPGGVVQVVDIAGVGIVEAAPLRADVERADKVHHRVVLAAHGHRAMVAGQPDIGLAPEDQATLPQLAAAGIEAVFQHEQRLHAAAQVLAAAQAEAAGLDHAAGQAELVMAARIVVVGQAFIDDAIEGHAALCASHLRESAD